MIMELAQTHQDAVTHCSWSLDHNPYTNTITLVHCNWEMEDKSCKMEDGKSLLYNKTLVHLYKLIYIYIN